MLERFQPARYQQPIGLIQHSLQPLHSTPLATLAITRAGNEKGRPIPAKPQQIGHSERMQAGHEANFISANACVLTGCKGDSALARKLQRRGKSSFNRTLWTGRNTQIAAVTSAPIDAQHIVADDPCIPGTGIDTGAAGCLLHDCMDATLSDDFRKRQRVPRRGLQLTPHGYQEGAAPGT